MREVQDISLYRDTSGRLLVTANIPNSFNGLLTNYDRYAEIKNSANSVVEIGSEVKGLAMRALQVDSADSTEHSAIWKKIAGIKSRKDKKYYDWENISVDYNPSKIKKYGISSGYTICCTKFDGHGFLGTSFMPKYELPLDVSDEELGATILKAFDQIKDIDLGIFDTRKKAK